MKLASSGTSNGGFQMGLIKERARMVRALVRWGGEPVDQLAYKQDCEIESMIDRLKYTVVVPDLDQEVRHE